MARILIIEDESVIRRPLRRLLERHGHRVDEADSVEKAADILGGADCDLVIADFRLPGAQGTAVIKHAAGAPVIIMTSYASVRSAVEAMRDGAVDYIAKPFDHDEMVLAVERALNERRMRRQNAALKADLAREYPVAGMIGRCAAMRQVFARIDKVAPTDTTVLIQGESGTGKELVARALHEKSPRRDAPLIAVNCAALPEGLIEAELFGHEKGAFTGAVGTRRGLVEAADGGTLFLDEIAELPTQAQARLLRVLQEGEIRRVGTTHARRVDVRLVAATHSDLAQRVRDGGFRQDLYFRIHVMEIRLPPLRERVQDIPELAEHLLGQVCQRLNRRGLRLAHDAVECLSRYSWPGNVRELRNAVERAVILSESNVIHAGAFDLGGEFKHERSDGGDATLGLSLEEYFAQFVVQHQDHMTETELARRLGISRKALWERRQRLGLPRRRHG